MENLMKYTGWRWYAWYFFCDREYPRNQRKSFLIELSLSLMIHCATIGFYFIWPFKLMSITLVFGTCLSMTSISVTKANEYLGYQVTLLLLALAAIITSFEWGFELFGHHLEHYLYVLLVLGSLVGLGRRIWNALAWTINDTIQGRNYEGDPIQ